MVIWFEEPLNWVSLWLGSVARGDVVCGRSVTADVLAFDCRGNLLGLTNVTVSADFNTPVRLDDAGGRIQQVVIDYGASACPEAIDDLAFQPGTASCLDTTPPVVKITSHPAFAVVNAPQDLLEGTVDEPGILASLRLDGTPP